MEQTIACKICGHPYKVFMHTVADQSACPRCIRQAEDMRNCNPLIPPYQTNGQGAGQTPQDEIIYADNPRPPRYISLEAEQLKQDNDSGDFGNALNGYSDRAETLELLAWKYFYGMAKREGLDHESAVNIADSELERI